MMRNIYFAAPLLLLPLRSAGFVLPSSSSLAATKARGPSASDVVVVGPLDLFGFGKKDDADAAVAEAPPPAQEAAVETPAETPTPEAPSEEVECVTEEDLNPMTKIKELGTAGALSLFLWEGAFWVVGIGGAIAAYISANGHFPTTKEEWAVAGGEAFAFANVARLFLPARIALAIATAPWVDENIVKRFFPKDKSDDECLVPEEASE